jgi:hypothetical protein
MAAIKVEVRLPDTQGTGKNIEWTTRAVKGAPTGLDVAKRHRQALIAHFILHLIPFGRKSETRNKFKARKGGNVQNPERWFVEPAVDGFRTEGFEPLSHVPTFPRSHVPSASFTRHPLPFLSFNDQLEMASYQ